MRKYQPLITATLLLLILSAVVVVATFGAASNTAPKAADTVTSTAAAKPPAPTVAPRVAPDPVLLIDNALRACQASGLVECHAELDSDGSIGVYGDKPTIVTTPVGLCPQEDSCAIDYRSDGKWYIYPAAH